jgi:hypothetical protein
MFILVQKVNKYDVNQQNYMEILNPFPMDTAENFNSMISQLQFPFVYDKEKTLGQNQRDFKDFFLVLPTSGVQL